MLKNKKIISIGGIIIILIPILIFDHCDRKYSYGPIPEEEFKKFSLYKTDVEVKQAYEKHFQDSIYLFPRGPVKKVIVFKNIPFVSRLTGKKIDKKKILNFVNNPQNFDWGETTWSPNESEYIVRFYNYNDDEIGKLWISLNDCGMTESIPFSPRMKFGELTTSGRNQLTQLFKTSYNE